MLKIRKAQIDAFSRASREDFVAKLALSLRAWFPEVCGELDDRALTGRTGAILDRALTHGITAERDVARFACLSFALGQGFDEVPATRELLADPSSTPAERLERVYAEIAAGTSDASPGDGEDWEP